MTTTAEETTTVAMSLTPSSVAAMAAALRQDLQQSVREERKATIAGNDAAAMSWCWHIDDVRAALEQVYAAQRVILGDVAPYVR